VKDRFWEKKEFDQMNEHEWESLCDGCGRCCLHRFEDEDDGSIIEVGVACKLLDVDTSRCSDYENRARRVPSCLVLTPDTVGNYPWLPQTCAYRRLHEGRALPNWHYLITGSRDDVHTRGPGIRGRVVSERDADPMDALSHLLCDEETH
jgi:uncharacterized cysteine cluster protein YcgN (CxxCxxCC family)